MPTARATFRFYTFQRNLPKVRHPPLFAPRRIGYLRSLANRVWAAEGRKGLPPLVVAGRGLSIGCDVRTWFVSYAHFDRRVGRYRIVLARQQRNVEVLLHELAHALGGNDKDCHGEAFTRRNFRLLLEHTRVPPDRLMAVAAKYLI
jgi:hypothetical protein